MIGLDVLNDQKVVRILRFMYRSKDAITGHSLSKSLGMASNTATKYLEQLTENGILERQIIGKAYVYQFREGYVNRELLVPLFQKEALVWGHIVSHIRFRLGPVSDVVLLYGDYVAMMADTVNVDLGKTVQLCCIASSGAGKLQARVEELESWLKSEFNLQLDCLQVSMAAFQEKQALALYQRIREEGVSLVGDLSLCSRV